MSEILDHNMPANIELLDPSNPLHYLSDTPGKLRPLCDELASTFDALRSAENDGFTPRHTRPAIDVESEWLHTPPTFTRRPTDQRSFRAELLLDLILREPVARTEPHIIEDAYAVHQFLRTILRSRADYTRGFTNTSPLLWRHMTPRKQFKRYMHAALISAINEGATTFSKRQFHSVVNPNKPYINGVRPNFDPDNPMTFYFTIDPPENTVPLIAVEPILT